MPALHSLARARRAFANIGHGRRTRAAPIAKEIHQGNSPRN